VIMGQTIVEKIMSAHAGRAVTPGEIVVVPVDGAMASDTTGPLAIKAFQAMGGEKVWNPQRCVLVIDHAAPAPNSGIANLHNLVREFAKEQGCRFFEVGQGICHQVIVENSLARPGEIIIGADSHTCTYGAVGALGAGMGSTDLAGVWLTGKTWLRVPKSQLVEFTGKIAPGVQGKDLILAVLAKIGIAGATYQSLELGGAALRELSLDSRMSMANMAIEAGAKTGFVHPEGLDLALSSPLTKPDPDAVYGHSLSIEAGGIGPMVSRPHSPDLGAPVEEFAGKAVQYCFIGTCVNGRLEDLRSAASILQGAKVHPETRLIVGPASQRVYLDAVADGSVQTLLKAGAIFIPPGCGPCVGTHNGVPGDGEVVISAANRNFVGRMGNPEASVYLASAATVAASARAGEISDPRQFLD
jgi:3-isopropylmalate/(R)-2-methylmalate dehydratase large subunit